MNCLSSTEVSSPPEYANTIFILTALRPRRVRSTPARARNNLSARGIFCWARSITMISVFSAHVFETLFDHRRLLGRFDDDEDGVVAADRAEDLGPVGAVDRGGQHHRRPRMRAQHDLVKRRARLDHDFGDDPVQPRAERLTDAGLDVLERAAGPAFERDFQQPELLDVTRDGRLRNLIALLLEQRRELVLRVHGPLRDQRKDRALALGLRLLQCVHQSVSPRRSVRRARSSAFCAWSRFSAWSKTTLCGPSITSPVTSSPRCAGRQCMKSACLAAAPISAASI